VRFLLDLTSDDEGRVSGEVAVAGGPSIPFSGWLELLRLLEDRTQEHRGQTIGRDDPGDGQEEATETWDHG
jgi:hypothetical protein